MHNPFLGSGPGRGQSPVEWGDFRSVRLSVLTINQRGLTAGEGGLKTNQRGLRVSQRTEGKLEGSKAQLKWSDDQRGGSDV